MGLIDTDAAYAVLTDYYHHSTDTQHAALREALGRVESVDAVPVVRCKDCKHNPKLEWFACPMASLSEKQRPKTAWCWKGERKDGDQK